MRHFLLQSVIFLTLIATTLAAGFIMLPPHKNNYLCAYKDKKQLLSNTPSPKTVFIGGSNLAFGVNSKRIADRFGTNVVNTALHAGIGLRFMLEDADKYLHKGDIAVISPEYQQFVNIMDGGPELTTILSLCDISTFTTLSPGQWSNFLSALPQHVYQSFKMRNKTWQHEIYSSYTFNEYGDHISHLDKPTEEGVDALPSTPPVNKDWCAYVAEKIKSWRKRGITVMLIPPVTIQSNYDANRETIADLYHCMDSLGTPFSVEAQRHVMPDTLAFDTPYHMRREGVRRFTRSIITEMEGMIKPK